MKVIFLHSDKPRERILAASFCEGVNKYPGDTAFTKPLDPEAPVDESADVAVMVGVKSLDLWTRYSRTGCNVVMLDKGYTRHTSPGAVRAWQYWRMSMNAHHPTSYLMKYSRPDDRMRALNLSFKPYQGTNRNVLLAGSSEKYHRFHGLPEPTQFAQKTVKRINSFWNGDIVYRAKPSWKGAVPITGARFDNKKDLYEELSTTHCVVTHGSNICFEALLAGVPVIVLGDAVAKPICNAELCTINSGYFPSAVEVRQWASNLAYCQWTLGEFASGNAWRVNRPHLLD